MKNLILIIHLLVIFSSALWAQDKHKVLSEKEKQVIVNKGTETPYTGKYYKYNKEGVYVCKRCRANLYSSNDKFPSDCGWPSFDDEITGAVKHVPDTDGKRTEIVCQNCNAHLGHVFLNEAYTAKNTRHCVNSISLDFIPLNTNQEVAIFAGGCFWGVEYLMEQQKGVISVEAGYIGGAEAKPTYQLMGSESSNYAEAVEIVFDSSIISYRELAKIFFEIHDPTQTNRQGPDIGKQYRSEIFYTNPEQKKIARELISILETKGYKIKTQVSQASTFYKAEDYHQNYYDRKGSTPYCHKYTKRF